MLINKKAVSTFMLIVLVLCAIIFGAFISYFWVIANYYNMPENTTLLIVKDATFPVHNARYFDVTILNPSNSISDVNITAMRLSVDGRTEVYDITTAEPSLPFLMRRGTEQTFRCEKNWSNFTGETVRIEPLAANASVKSSSYLTPTVKLKVTPNFDASQSIEYFNLTVENSAESIINLTISEITIQDFPLNTTPAVPHVLSPNKIEIFRCERNWEELMGVNVTITVKTSEGYESVYMTDKLPGATLSVDEIKFDYADTSHFNLTVKSSEDSTTAAVINKVNLTLADGATITLNTTPPLYIIPIPILPNQSLTIKCLWDWNMSRNETITARVYTQQGFTAPSMTLRTPPAVVWNITDVKFDLDDVKHFEVNVTSMPCSLDEIKVTKILLDQNETATTAPIVVFPGEQKVINCTLPWKDWINKSVTITVSIEDGLNIFKIVPIPSVGLKLLGDTPVFGDLQDLYTNITIPYVNVTISNSINSLQNVTITKIIIEAGNETYEVDGILSYPKLAPNGYILKIGENITITCLWDYTLLGPNPIKVTVYTAEGFQISRTWQVSGP